MAYDKPNPKAHLRGSTEELPDVLMQKLEELKKLFSKDFLEKQGAIHGECKKLPILGFPMHTGAYHCINYSTYPAKPRFLTAARIKGDPTTLGFLGNVKKLPKTVYITEGIWDRLTLVREGYKGVLGLPGVNNLNEGMLKLLSGKKVYLCFDNDGPGMDFAQKHGRRIAEVADVVYSVNIPQEIRDVPLKDVSDLFDKSVTPRAYFEKLIEAAAEIHEATAEERIRDVILSKGNSVGKSYIITDIIVKDIEGENGKVVPHNNSQELGLIIRGTEVLLDEDVDIYLTRTYEYIPSDSTWRYVKERLYAYALKQTDLELHTYSTYKDGKFYLGVKGQGVLRITPTEVLMFKQGIDGVYIKSKLTLPMPSELKGKKAPENLDTLEKMFESIQFDGDPEGQRFLVKVWFYQTFFNMKLRTTLCITGEPGCGKTLLQKIMKGVLFGFAKSDPNRVPEEDYVFTTMLKEYKYLFLDEVNESDPKMKSKLRMLATGEETVFRPKYARRSIRFRPDVYLAISAHSPKFRDADIAQRLCILTLLHPKKSLEKREIFRESEYLKKLEQAKPFVWLNIVRKLQNIITNLQKNRDERIPLTNYCRQIEMATFAYQAFPEERDLCVRVFNNLGKSQADFSAEFDPLCDVLQQYLEEVAEQSIGKENFTAREIHNGMNDIAREKGIRAMPGSVKGLAKWMSNREGFLEEKFGMEKVRDTVSNSWSYKFDLGSMWSGEEELPF